MQPPLTRCWPQHGDGPCGRPRRAGRSEGTPSCGHPGKGDGCRSVAGGSLGTAGPLVPCQHLQRSRRPPCPRDRSGAMARMWHPRDPSPSLVAGLGGLSSAWCSAPAPASGSSRPARPLPTFPQPPAPHPGRPAGRAGAPFLPPVLQALTRLQLLPLEPAHPHPPPPRPPQRPLQRPGQRWGQLPQVTWQLLFAPVSLRDHPCARGTRPPPATPAPPRPPPAPGVPWACRWGWPPGWTSGLPPVGLQLAGSPGFPAAGW